MGVFCQVRDDKKFLKSCQVFEPKRAFSDIKYLHVEHERNRLDEKGELDVDVLGRAFDDERVGGIVLAASILAQNGNEIFDNIRLFEFENLVKGPVRFALVAEVKLATLGDEINLIRPTLGFVHRKGDGELVRPRLNDADFALKKFFELLHSIHYTPPLKF